MKIEICPETKWAVIIASVAIAIATIAVTALWTYNDRAKAAFSAGLEEGMLPGSHETSWVRSKK